MKSKADNNFTDIISKRQSVRAFLPKKVPDGTLHHILDTARWAPSGVNTQPWKVIVVGDKAREKIADDIIQARISGIAENPDYQYYPTEWTEPYKSRRKACGLALYQSLNIAKDDMPRRQEQWFKNYHFFHAPAGLIFYIEPHLCKGSWMDMGMFIQNVMLAARCFGLETCPQAALAEYPDIIRKHCQIETGHIVCGMALGYADWEQPENQYRTEREPVEAFSRWIK